MKQRQKQATDFRYAKVKESDSDEGENTELLVKKSSYKEVPTTEIALSENDTLQAISIKYRCTIEELKRLNNIHKENEIFARRSLRVPHKPFHEALAGIHSSGKGSPNSSEPVTDNSELLKKKLSSTLLNLSENDHFNQAIFNSQLTVVETKESYDSAVFDAEEEEVRLLPQSVEAVIEKKSVTSSFTCSGADADISWIALIVCIVLVIFVGPLIYVLYVAEHPEEFHHEPHMKPA